MSWLEPVRSGKIWELYQMKAINNWLALIVAGLIGTGTIYYTNSIVTELAERERRYIELFANTLEYAALEENSDNLIFIIQEIIGRNNSIPVILTDPEGFPEAHRNISFPKNASEETMNRILEKELRLMRKEHEPIVVSNIDRENDQSYVQNLVFYRNSDLLYRLKYYPYIQLSAITIFILLGYLFINSSRRAEQNRVWVGLAKETAHQLGTPISSLMAWVEFLKSDKDFQHASIINDLEKDLHRLEMVTSRFSSIGSVPVLSPEDVKECITQNINYLQSRISSKVQILLEFDEVELRVPLNKPLFDWVIENLCKNSVDAMGGSGTITITAGRGRYDDILIDIKDTGKGMTSAQMKQVFQPGFTTKKRGWGLGLTLAKRIIENYHKGKIYVKESAPDKGTTFRIILMKS
jgi:two-component system, sporulation sensor kinase E